MDRGYGSSNSLRKWFNHDDILKKKIREMESDCSRTKWLFIEKVRGMIQPNIMLF